MHASGAVSARLMPMRTMALLVLAGLALGGCSFTEVDPAAQRIEVLEAARVSHCERLGDTQVSVAHKVGFIARGDEAIQNDLNNLARNSAADMGGDTVTPIDEPRNGKQTFEVYDCIEE